MFDAVTRALIRLVAAVRLGLDLARAVEAAAADGVVSEAELGGLAVRAVRLYEQATGRTVLTPEKPAP